MEDDYTIKDDEKVLYTSVHIGTTGIAATSIVIEDKNGKRSLLATGDDHGDAYNKKMGLGQSVRGCKVILVTVISFHHLSAANFNNAVNSTVATYIVMEKSADGSVVSTSFQLDKDEEVESDSDKMVAIFKKTINLK